MLVETHIHQQQKQKHEKIEQKTRKNRKEGRKGTKKDEDICFGQNLGRKGSQIRLRFERSEEKQTLEQN